jgi:hypothetical protein
MSLKTTRRISIKFDVGIACQKICSVYFWYIHKYISFININLKENRHSQKHLFVQTASAFHEIIFLWTEYIFTT